MTRRSRASSPALRVATFGGVTIAAVLVLRFNLVRPVTQTAFDVLTPVQTSLFNVSLPGAAVISDSQDAAALRAIVEQQRGQIEQMNGQIVRARELEIENQRLKDELDFRKANPGFELKAADVIGQDPTNLIRSVTINQGEAAGLKPGMVVIDSAGSLVGRITQVATNSAKVLLLTDPSSSVYAMLQAPESRAIGLVDGQYGPYLKMSSIAQTENVNRGDVVVTSGRGPNYPKGLFVGRVLEVHRNNTDAFQEAIVDPAARLSKLEAVLVITNFLPRSEP